MIKDFFIQDFFISNGIIWEANRLGLAIYFIPWAFVVYGFRGTRKTERTRLEIPRPRS